MLDYPRSKERYPLSPAERQEYERAEGLQAAYREAFGTEPYRTDSKCLDCLWHAANAIVNAGLTDANRPRWRELRARTMQRQQAEQAAHRLTSPYLSDVPPDDARRVKFFAILTVAWQARTAKRSLRAASNLYCDYVAYVEERIGKIRSSVPVRHLSPLGQHVRETLRRLTGAKEVYRGATQKGEFSLRFPCTSTVSTPDDARRTIDRLHLHLTGLPRVRFECRTVGGVDCVIFTLSSHEGD